MAVFATEERRRASTSGKPFLSCRERFCDADQEVPPGFRGSARWNPCEGRPFEWWAETNTDPRDTTLTIDRIAVTETRQTLVGQADGPIDIGLSTRVGVREALGLSASCGHEKERTPGKDETPSKTR